MALNLDRDGGRLFAGGVTFRKFENYLFAAVCLLIRQDKCGMMSRAKSRANTVCSRQCLPHHYSTEMSPYFREYSTRILFGQR